MSGLLREALRSLAAQKVSSAVTLVLVASMCIAVLLTTGRAEGSQQAVLATIDSAGTRSIVVRATPEAELHSDVLDRLTAIDGVEAAVALGSAHDVRNARLPDGTPVPLRDYWGSGIGSVAAGEAIASPTALAQLGMQSPVGVVVNGEGDEIAVVGEIPDPSMLAGYEPLLLTPRAQQDVGEIGVLVIIATEASAVAAVTEVIRPIVSDEAAGGVKLESSPQLASLRGTVNEQLGAFGAALAAGALVIAGALVAVVQSALVLLKRKDWGRRRALGASRSLVSALIIAQAGIVSVAGAALGTGISLVVLLLWRDPAPSAVFVAAVAILAVAVTLLASLLPALIASRRDPIKELRVP